jgi:hypothetical protein
VGFCFNKPLNLFTADKKIRIVQNGFDVSKTIDLTCDDYPISENELFAITEVSRVPATTTTMATNTTDPNFCPSCNKTFKQIKQHITKSHNRYVIRIVGDAAYMSYNDGPEVEGSTPYQSDDDDEWEFYPDGYDGVETITLVRNKTTGKTRVHRYAKGKKMYLHNIKIQQ